MNGKDVAAMAKKTSSLIPVERIQRAILLIRGQKVLLDADLAELYEVETKALVRAVKRNSERFPADVMFQLSAEEFEDLRCQFGTSSPWGGRRYAPYAFTEQGVAMLSSGYRDPAGAGGHRAGQGSRAADPGDGDRQDAMFGRLKADLTIPDEVIDRRILLARGQKVLLDSDLANLYEVTKRQVTTWRASSNEPGPIRSPRGRK
jgi:hypothetical protein